MTTFAVSSARNLALAAAFLLLPGEAHALSGGALPAPLTGCGSSTTTTATFSGTTGPIAQAANYDGTTFTAVVSGADTYLWDVDLTTAISHTFNAHLDITLISPAGTVVVISTDNGENFVDVFNGTLWDDNVNVPVARYSFTNHVAAPELSPEGRLQAFRGENPNGTWKLRVYDDATTQSGTMNSWSLAITTLATPPVETTTNFTRSPNVAIPDLSVMTDTLNVSGVGTHLDKVTLFVNIPHGGTGDLDIRLTSPAGTTVFASDRRGGFFDNVFAGTTFDPDGLVPLTDEFFANFLVIPLVAPEGSFDNFLGEDPNGTWTLRIADGGNFGTGTLVRWDLNITSTASAASPSAPRVVDGTTGPIQDFSASTPVKTTFTADVSGMTGVLWDLDLTTLMWHESCRDLDVTLTSPAGTTITITTDNGNVFDNVFYGTRWDDSASECVGDHTYSNFVLAPLLAPEGRLSAFRGEDPNGTWTLSVTDDEITNVGAVDGWGLDVTTIDVIPGETFTVVSHTPGLVFSPTPPLQVATDVIVMSGLDPFVLGVELFLGIAHSEPTSITIQLTAPSGKTVTVTSNNRGGIEGTLVDPLWPVAVTDYVSPVVAPIIAPEGGFDAFIGEDPNGGWTLTVADGNAGAGGTWARWDLRLKTCGGAGHAFCANGTLDADHTTACPCGNTGNAGHGCAHSFDANGARLTGSGSSAADTVVLRSQSMPANAFTLFLQHSAADDTVFHDGVLCAGGALIRLRGRSAAGGEASFPNSAFAADATTTLSARGGTSPGSGFTARYAAWFRNASTTFCPPATANVSNGWIITW